MNCCARIGSAIQPGYLADLVLLSANPLEGHPQTVDRLPNIIEFPILDENRVYLRTEDNRMLHRITSEGGLYDDHHYIDGDTGEMKETENPRAYNEIELTIGESSQDGMYNLWNILQPCDNRIHRTFTYGDRCVVVTHRWDPG